MFTCKESESLGLNNFNQKISSLSPLIPLILKESILKTNYRFIHILKLVLFSMFILQVSLFGGSNTCPGIDEGEITNGSSITYTDTIKKNTTNNRYHYIDIPSAGTVVIKIESIEKYYQIDIGTSCQGSEIGTRLNNDTYSFPSYTITDTDGDRIFISHHANSFSNSNKREFKVTITFTATTTIVENADDICYESAKASGWMCIDIGICSGGIGCTNSYPLKNIGDDTLSNVVIDYDETGLGGTFADDCGVEPSGSCEAKSNIDLGPIGLLGQVTEFTLSNSIAVGDNSNSIWGKTFMSGSCFSGENLYATYIKDGVTYRGEVSACNESTDEPEDEEIPTTESNATEAICGSFEDVLQTRDDPSEIVHSGGASAIVYDSPDCTLNTGDVDFGEWQELTCEGGIDGEATATGSYGTALNPIYDGHTPAVASISSSPSLSTTDVTVTSSQTLTSISYDDIDIGSGGTGSLNVSLTNVQQINSLDFTTNNSVTFSTSTPYNLEIGSIGTVNNGSGNSLTTSTVPKNIKINTLELPASATIDFEATQTIKMETFTIGRDGTEVTLKAQYININNLTQSNSYGGTSHITIIADYVDIGSLDLDQGATIEFKPYTAGKRVLFQTNSISASSSSSMIVDSGNYYTNSFAIPGTSNVSSIAASDDSQLINFYINGNFSPGNNPGINSAGNSGNYGNLPPENFILFINGDLNTGGGGTTFNATIYVEGSATMGSPTYLQGALSAGGDITIGQGSKFYYDQGVSDAGWGVCEASNLIGDYRFDECSVTSLIDSSGNNNNGTIINATSEYLFAKHKEKGMLCRAGRFYSFIENYATAGTNLKSTNDNLSIAFSLEWSGQAGKLPIISRENDYEVYLEEGKLYYTFGDSSPIVAVDNITINPKQTAHLAFIVNGSSVKVYKNGSLEYTNSSYTYAHPTLNTNTTYIGGDGNGNYFGGLLDEIKFYDSLITQDEITTMAGKQLRPCNCCSSQIKIVGDYISISNTYDASQPLFDAKNYLDNFEFDEPPLLFMLPSNDGTHSAYLRARNVDSSGFEVANIEPQGEDGPHIAMNLNYLAINEGVHNLGEYTLESCTIPIQTEQVHDRGFLGNDVNKSNRTPDNFNQNIVCDTNGCWTKIEPVGTYINPVVFATIATDNNERRVGALEVSYPWMSVAIKNDDTGIWISLERSETTKGVISQPEEVAYIITEGNIQSSFFDDFDNNISYETVLLRDRFKGYDQRNTLVNGEHQRFDFINTYTNVPLVMANKNSRKDVDGGWFRRNNLTKTYMQASIWEDHKGAYASEGNYDDPTNPETPISYSYNQDTERNRDTPDDGALIAFDNVFKFAETYKPATGSFDAVENGASYNTILDTKIVGKPFSLRFWSLDAEADGTINGPKVINSPVKVDLIYSQDPSINLGNDCNTSALIIPNSTKYVNFITPNAYLDNNDFNISDRAYRNVQVRFTYASDESNETANWLQCYSNANNCGNNTYTSNCTSTCQTHGATSIECGTCYFDNELSTNIKQSCSFDRFAIRPDSYNMGINGDYSDNQTITSGVNFQLNIDANNFQSPPIVTQDYNATQDSFAGVNFAKFIVDTTVINTTGSCLNGEILGMNDGNFTNGIFQNNNGYFTEIGDINITVYEDNLQEFAKVDTGNLDPTLDSNDSVRRITNDIIKVHFIPDHFDLNISLSNFHDGNFTYYDNNASVMQADLDFTIQAMNDKNVSLVNFKNGCAAEDLNHTITFDYNTTSNLNMIFVDDNDSTNTIQSGPLLSSTATTTILNVIESNTSFTGSPIVGGAIENYKINFSRSATNPVNPISISIHSIDVWDKNQTNDYTEINLFTSTNNAKFYYGRVHAPDQRFDEDHGDAKIYYEVYCDGCVKADFNITGNESVDSINWFTNKLHTTTDGNVSKYLSVGSTTLDGGQETHSVTIIDGKETILVATTDTPYKDKINMTSNSWLEFSPTDFMVEFYGGGDWAGQGIQGKTVDINISKRQNKRLDW